MIGVTWTGWDGSHWDLHKGPVYLQPGVDLFSMLTGDAFVRQTALTDGQRFSGWRAEPRAGLLPVLIGRSQTETEWLALDRAWWRTMRIDRPGTLTVTAPDGSVRRLKLRFVNDGGVGKVADPSQRRMEIAPIKMVADDPWWVGDSFGKVFRNGGVPVNFFGGEVGLGSPYVIGASSTTATATITNPGDDGTWPVYTVDGPVTAFSAIIDGREVAGDFTVAAGQQLRVDTSPQQQVAHLIDGETQTNVTRQMRELQFAQVPDGTAVALSIQISGTGSLTITAEPNYYKAW